jgi:hypothetical protein
MVAPPSISGGNTCRAAWILTTPIGSRLEILALRQRTGGTQADKPSLNSSDWPLLGLTTTSKIKMQFAIMSSVTVMVRNAKDLSPDQKLAIESLLGWVISQDECVSVRTMPPAPDWLEKAWKGAKERGLDRVTPDEIQAEIDSYRREAASDGTR